MPTNGLISAITSKSFLFLFNLGNFTLVVEITDFLPSASNSYNKTLKVSLTAPGTSSVLESSLKRILGVLSG